MDYKSLYEDMKEKYNSLKIQSEEKIKSQSKEIQNLELKLKVIQSKAKGKDLEMEGLQLIINGLQKKNQGLEMEIQGLQYEMEIKNSLLKKVSEDQKK